MAFLNAVGTDAVRFCRDETGGLYRWENGRWEVYPFNALYEGYFPPCRFTALGYFDGQFYIVGVDKSNRTRMYLSMAGNVWTEQELVSVDPMGARTVLMGAVVSMLYLEQPNQVMLLTEAGMLAVIPDCPRCIRIGKLEQVPEDAWLDGGKICIRWKSGKVGMIPQNVVDQVRVAWDYAEVLMQQYCACVIDLRPVEEKRQTRFTDCIRLPPEAVPEWLEGQGKETYLFFLCRFGVQADQCAQLARRKGFVHAYSLGGTEKFAHLE